MVKGTFSFLKTCIHNLRVPRHTYKTVSAVMLAKAFSKFAVSCKMILLLFWYASLKKTAQKLREC
jgi:hypothetical protein